MTGGQCFVETPKKVKERIIVKFVRRDKRNEIYKQRSKLHGKDTSCLPSVAAELGKSIAVGQRRFILTNP